MPNNLYIPLSKRAVISVAGGDSTTFLQGLITNDISKVTEHKAIAALMLTPQGKFLYEFFIINKGGVFYIDCSKEHISTIIKKLSMYKLRSDVTIADESEKYEVVALIGEGVFLAVEHNKAGDVKQFCKGAAYIDPRSEKLFARAIIERENEYQSFKAYEFELGKQEQYEELRVSVGIPSGDEDMQSGDSFPLDFSMDELNAIDYAKGCYVGQEVTARVHYRGKLRKRVYVLHSEEELSPFGVDVIIGGAISGKLLSSSGNKALALLKLEDVAKSGNECKVGEIKANIQQAE